MEVGDIFSNSNGSRIVQITESNMDAVLSSHELVFMFAYVAGNTRRNQISRLTAIFENAEKEITKARLGPGKVVMAKLDCSKNEEAIRTRFKIYISYPCFILLRNCWRSQNYYRGQHTVEALVEFIKEELTDTIIPFNHLNELRDLSEDKGHVVAYLESKEQPEYDVLRKVATTLKDNYRFYVKLGDSAEGIYRTGQLRVVFRSTTGIPVETDEKYRGSLLSFSDIHFWVKYNCFPLLPEFTLENEERLRKRPFLILIHEPSDTQSPKKYKELIRRELESERCEFNFCIANGIRFQKCLERFNKSTTDLPLLAFDCYRYVNLFDLNDVKEPGKLNEILNQAYSKDFYKRGIYFGRLIEDTAEEDYHISGLFE